MESNAMPAEGHLVSLEAIAIGLIAGFGLTILAILIVLSIFGIVALILRSRKTDAYPQSRETTAAMTASLQQADGCQSIASACRPAAVNRPANTSARPNAPGIGQGHRTRRQQIDEVVKFVDNVISYKLGEALVKNAWKLLRKGK